MSSMIRDPRRALLCGFVILLAVVPLGCGAATETDDAGDGAPALAATGDDPAAAAEPLAPGVWLEEVALGREVDTQGAIPRGSRADQFGPGETIYVSLDLVDAPPQAAVHVTFSRPGGGTVAEDEKKVPAGAGYLYFDSGDTAGWEAGEYRVAIAVGGETVRELAFRITG